MRTTSTTTKVITAGGVSAAVPLIVKLTIDGNGGICSIGAAGDSVGAAIVGLDSETFDRIAAIVALHREETSRSPVYASAPKCCPDHGHHDGYRCEKCAAAEKASDDGGGA